MRVLIVGAGPTGLTAALELRRRGVEADVIDRRDEGSTFSRAVGITPRSLEILEPSGATENLLAAGMKFREARFYRDARPMLALPFRVARVRHGFDFILGLAQDRTETVLLDRLRHFGGDVRFGVELVSLAEQGGQVLAGLGDGTEISCDYLLGADGVHSTTRTALGLDFPGHDLPETWSIADVDAKGWPNRDAFTACQLAAGNVVVVVPLEPARYRVISSTPDALAALPLEMDVTNIRRQGAFTISIRQVEDYARGRVFLAGDAAHCHSPVGGRGMNLGIADAVDFARRVAEGGLAGYSAARHAEGAETIHMSERARKVLTSTNPVVRALVLAGMRLASVTPFLQRRAAARALYG